MKGTVLFLSPCTPDPQGTGWEQRAYSTLYAYAQKYDVVSWIVPTYDAPGLDRLCLAAALSKQVHTFDLENVDEYLPQLQSAAREASIVHFFRTTAKLLLKLECTVAFWDLDELPWSCRPKRPDHVLDEADEKHSQAEKAEFIQCVNQSTRIYVASELELDASILSMRVLPNIVNIVTPSTSTDATNKDKSLLFVGNLNYEPNADGLRYFVDNIWPLVRSQVPEARLRIVGRAPGEDVKHFKLEEIFTLPGVEVFTNVPQVKDFYQRSQVAICPIRGGGGTRIKLLEAFAYRCPVVTTKVGCEGLGVTHNYDVLIASDPTSFAKSCSTLLQDQSLCKRLAESAHSYYLQNHTQLAVTQILHQEFDSLQR